MGLTSSRIRAVNAVYEAGNFSLAAKRLGVSQPAVAQQIRDLERDFGITLFDRRGNGLAPTTICDQLYNVTARIQAHETEAVAVLKQHADLTGGELRIGLGNSMPGMRLIRSLQRHFPTIRIKAEMGSWSSIIHAVVDQRVDVGVLPDVPDDGRFRRKDILRQGVVAIVHPNHPLADVRQTSCSELMQHRLIFRTRQSSTQRVVDRAFSRAQLKPEPMIILDTRDGVFEAVANELGVGFMWEHGSSRTDKIKKIHVPEMDAEVPEYIFCLAGRKDKLVDLFFDQALIHDL